MRESESGNLSSSARILLDQKNFNIHKSEIFAAYDQAPLNTVPAGMGPKLKVLDKKQSPSKKMLPKNIEWE